MRKFIEKLPLLMSITIVVLLALFFIITIFASELTLDETKKQLGGDPCKIAEWMKNNIKPIDEDFQYAQTPQKTYKYKKGDCEDLAILVQYLIEDSHPSCLIMWEGTFSKTSKYYKRYGKIEHVVLAVYFQNSWGIIDQDKFIYAFSSLKEAILFNCQMRRIDVSRAWILKMYRWKIDKLEQIIGE